ncbi:MAG: hypothetical protein AAFU71_18190 [Cyanobacteria bacterium J06632_22]
MENVIVNAHVVDSRNIGDLASSPIPYFDFDYRVETLDLRSIDPKFSVPQSGFGGSITLDEIRKTSDQVRYHLIIGGGGLLYKQFLRSYKILESLKSVFRGHWIAWGVGQQVYALSGEKSLIPQLSAARDGFAYQQYLSMFDLVGIRDQGFDYDWIPCASCLHPTFDKPREPRHDVVVFSHRKFKLKLGNLPCMSHDTQSLEEVIDFLGSGKTIISSSYHGAYWGTLLGRRVVAFPFSTKFLTLKHPPVIYPIQQWNYSRFKFRPFKQGFLNRIKLEYTYGNHYTCRTQNWQATAALSQSYSDILQQYRDANIHFYRRVLSLLSE